MTIYTVYIGCCIITTYYATPQRNDRIFKSKLISTLHVYFFVRARHNYRAYESVTFYRDVHTFFILCQIINKRSFSFGLQTIESRFVSRTCRVLHGVTFYIVFDPVQNTYRISRVSTTISEYLNSREAVLSPLKYSYTIEIVYIHIFKGKMFLYKRTRCILYEKYMFE